MRFILPATPCVILDFTNLVEPRVLQLIPDRGQSFPIIGNKFHKLLKSAGLRILEALEPLVQAPAHERSKTARPLAVKFVECVPLLLLKCALRGDPFQR